jgi:hypothetical protein
VLAFAPCGSGGSGPGYNVGGASGALGGSITGPNKGGGTGGTGSTPRPDPAIAARQANRQAALNNPLPIPGAMLQPLYGGSMTAPVSSAPDIPSHATGAYQDPVDDINQSYNELQQSLTDESQPVVGTLKNVNYAPSDITPAKTEFDPHHCDGCDKGDNDDLPNLLPPPASKPSILNDPPAPKPTTTGTPRRTGGLLGVLLTLSQLLAADSPQGKPRTDIKDQARRCANAPGALVAEIYYHDLDYKDRATGAEACLQGRVDPDLRDDHKRFTPPGFIKDMDRGHLIARELGGSNTNPKNIVPMFPDVNQTEVRGVERIITSRLDRGERVYVYVQVVYGPNNLNEYIPNSINIYISSESGAEWFYIDNFE